MFGQTKPDSWWKSPDGDAEYRRRRAKQRAFYRRKAREEVADPEEISSTERRRQVARREYFSRNAKRCGDPRWSLPSGGDLQAFADTFGAESQTLAQAFALSQRGLLAKAKRLILCGRMGHRVDCMADEAHKFFQPYMCRGRYCTVCGPAWFQRRFSELLAELEPVVEHLLHEGQTRGRKTVVAKIDFTVPNTGRMPTPDFVRKFHADLHRFWRAVERRFGISRKEYGQGGCDEFGGGNTNLHRHCVYAGPILPQRKKELSALWSEIRGERSFVSIKRARSFSAALAHALKYPAKFLSASTPDRLAELEATFHRTRKFSTGGAFYGLKLVREPGEDSPIGECPICGARLCELVASWVPRFVLEREGRRDVEGVRREVGRQKVFSGASPP